MAQNKKRLPTSGDRLTDWHFREIVNTLEQGVAAIRKKKRLVSLDDKPPRKSVRGLLDRDLIMIFLNAAKSMHPTWQDYVETLIHEAAHLLNPISRHKSIYKLENILMVKFTDNQKRYLKNFIPKKEVKKDPPPAPTDSSGQPEAGKECNIPPEALPDFDTENHPEK